MTDSFQQGLGAFEDTGTHSGDWEKVGAVVAGTAAVMDTGDETHLLLLTGTWTPSRGERSVSIQSHVFDVLRSYCDDDAPLYVVDKDRRSPKVYRYELGDFDANRCKVYPPRDDVATITHEQHTVPLSHCRAKYHSLNDGQKAFIRLVEEDIPMRLQI